MHCSTIGLTRAAGAAAVANTAASGYGAALLDAATSVSVLSSSPANAHTLLSNNNSQRNNLSQQCTMSTTTTNGINGISACETQSNCKQVAQAAKIIQQSHVICFDVDSTVIREEGIDELANFCGKGAEVARITKQAMGGGMTFQDALKIRLNTIKPTQQQITEFIQKHPSTLTTNVKAFIEQLKRNGKHVYLVSGGFDCLIEPVANELGIPMTNVFANKLLFFYNGDYASFDTTQPTSRTGGKAEAVSQIRNRYTADNVITMIGDGATDLEAVPPANYFIGFGGNVLRAEVFKRAQYYVTDFQQLIQ